jgi:hypothetical protein
VRRRHAGRVPARLIHQSPPANGSPKNRAGHHQRRGAGRA